MKISSILCIIAGYMLLVAYILAVINALRGTPDGAMTYIHAIGAFILLCLAALFVFADDYNQKGKL